MVNGNYTNIEVPVPIQDSEQTGVVRADRCATCSDCDFSTLIFDFGICPTVWHCFLFFFIWGGGRGGSFYIYLKTNE